MDLADEPNVLSTALVTAKHTEQNLENTYWHFVNNHIPFNNMRDVGVRDWLYQHDNITKWLYKLHEERREEE